MGLFSASRTLVMGILNVTPDSFSDGGEFFDAASAVDHGLALVGEGADLIDVGGESTRPGSTRTDLGEELRRVLPVVEALADAGVAVSVDTMRHEVAEASVASGAALVNDVSAGLADEEMLATIARLGVPYCAMHWRAQAATMQELARYDDVVADVLGELRQRVDACLAAGIQRDRLVIDPGIGFSKTAEHNWELLRRFEDFTALGFPVLVGVSRKRFLGELLAEGLVDRPPKGRDDASAAVTAWVAARGAWGVRTHAVRAHRDAIAVIEKLGGSRG